MIDKKWIFYEPICFLDGQEFLTLKGDTWEPHIEEWKKHNAPLFNAGANAIRVFAYSTYGKHGRDKQFSPYQFVKAENAWDLSKRDPQYFPVFKQFVRAAIELAPKNMTVWICLFNQGESAGVGSVNSPLAHNIQGYGSVYDRDAGKYLGQFFDDLAGEMEEFGDHVGYHFANEARDGRFPDMARDHLFPVIKKRNLPFNLLGYGAAMDSRPYLGGGKYADKPPTVQDTVREHFGAYFGEKNKTLVLREVHGVGVRVDDDRPFGDNVAQAVCWWDKVNQSEHLLVGDWIASTDAQKHGDSLCDRDFDGARPSAEVMGAMAAYIWKRVDNAHIAHCPQTMNTDCLALTFGEVSKAYKNGPGKGKWPANFGKVHYVPPQPPDPPKPPKPPEPKPPEPPEPPKPKPPEPPSTPPVPPHPWIKDNWGWVALAALLTLLALSIFL